MQENWWLRSRCGRQEREALLVHRQRAQACGEVGGVELSSLGIMTSFWEMGFAKLVSLVIRVEQFLSMFAVQEGFTVLTGDQTVL